MQDIFEVHKNVKKLMEHPLVFYILTQIYNRTAGYNHIRGRTGNVIQTGRAVLQNSRISIKGKNNWIQVGEKSYLKHCNLYIRGNNNSIVIERQVSAVACEIYMEDDSNHVQIGEYTHISGKTHIACIEGTKVSIGKNSLLSSDVTFRSGDSHAILNTENQRINPSADIRVGEHVWIGNRTILTKGAEIADDSVVATGAVVTRQFREGNVILGGIPAKVLKENINWKEER